VTEALHEKKWVSKPTVTKVRGVVGLWEARYGWRADHFPTQEEAFGYAYIAACAMLRRCHKCGHHEDMHIEGVTRYFCVECSKDCYAFAD
jgi:hypothetical protein